MAPGAKKKPKKHVRSPHPGVVILPPSGRHGWRAKFEDADSGKEVRKAFPKDVTTAEQRRQWAIDKSKDLDKRRHALEGGAVRASGKDLATVLGQYEKNHPQLRPRTLEIANAAKDKLIDFAKMKGLVTADDVTRAFLLQLKAHLIALPKKKSKAGGKRGEYATLNEPRSAVAVNQDLVALRTMLGYLVDLDQFARLSYDDLRRALKKVPVAEKRTKCLKPEQCRALIVAALAHDADTFDLTREEKDAGMTKGSTPKFPAIAPFVAFCLLSGVRRGEAISLDWANIDLEAKDSRGVVTGEIEIEGSATKTKKRRTLDLAVSPALASMLRALHERRGKPTKGSVFDLTEPTVIAAQNRLRDDYKAPKLFSWQVCRSTCATFLVNAPGIFGAASAYRSAKQLGHSVAVSEKHYLNVLRGIDPNVKALEGAMAIEKELAAIEQALR